MLATLHDAAGNVAVAGLDAAAYEGARYDEPAFRRDAGVLGRRRARRLGRHRRTACLPSGDHGHRHRRSAGRRPPPTPSWPALAPP